MKFYSVFLFFTVLIMTLTGGFVAGQDDSDLGDSTVFSDSYATEELSEFDSSTAQASVDDESA